MRGVLALLIWALAPIAAQAQPKQPTDVELKALGETAGEMEECSAFFMVVAACLGPQEPKLAGDYEKKGKQIGGLSFTLLKNFGMSEEAISARYDLFTNSMMNAMQKNCTNIAVLLQRYLNFCQRLSEDAYPRLKEWVQCFQTGRERSCGSPGVPGPVPPPAPPPSTTLPAPAPPPSTALPPPAPPPSTQTQVHKQVQVIEDLQLREQPDPRARNILGAPPDDRMPKGSQVAVIDFCRPWMGSGRGAQDADNIWCPVLYEGQRGWANAYFLADDHGERVACVMYPTARGCASTAGR